MILIPSKSHLFIETLWFLTKPLYRVKTIKKLKQFDMEVVLIDNSVHLLGEPLNFDVMNLVYNEISERHIRVMIAPDYLLNTRRTLHRAIPFIEKAHEKSIKVMGVVQGNQYSEYRTCYETFLLLKVFAIGFPFRQGDCLPQARELRRADFIRELRRTDIIDEDKYHHLLGLNTPKSYKLYEGFDFIKSCDSSKIKEVRIV